MTDELLVRDAMVSEPLALDVTATAQEAGAALASPKVKALFVCDGENLIGVITRKTLVRNVVAAGLDSASTTLAGIAEPAVCTIESSTPLGAAFTLLEERDLERVPVVEGSKLVGVLSRDVVSRRLAEDEPPPALDAE